MTEEELKQKDIDRAYFHSHRDTNKDGVMDKVKETFILRCYVIKDMLQCTLLDHRFKITSIECFYFWTLRVGTYSKWALIRGWTSIKFLPFSAKVVSNNYCSEITVVFDFFFFPLRMKSRSGCFLQSLTLSNLKRTI